MKLRQSFEVRAPVDRVWDILIDIERVAPCLPGADITEAHEDGSYRGSFNLKLGPTTAAYRGQLKIDKADRAGHHVRMHASGQDKRGQGSAKATIASSLHQEGDLTRVEVETDFTITGRLARFGRGGMIEDVSNRLMQDFAACLQRSIEGPAIAEGTDAEAPEGEPPPPSSAKPIRGLSLFFSVLLERIRRLFQRR